MGWIVKAVAAWCVCTTMAFVPAFAGQKQADFGTVQASDEARSLAHWAVATSDHQGLPFAVVDKRQARLYVFDAQGRLTGDAPVLLGQAIGDESSPDVGEHTQAGFVPMNERTTPAGRFLSEPGRNTSGEAVVWVDYEAAFAIHRVRPGTSLRAREARLASPSAEDRRASLGCVVVPVQFYERVVDRVLGRSRAVVYVLPETTPLRQVFSAL